MTVTFELGGQEFIALNGGPEFTFSPAISFFVRRPTQAEVDHFWNKLADGGRTLQCGRLTDRYGVTWQVVPTVLGEMLRDENPERAQRVMEAMMKMVKLDTATPKQACDQS